MGCVACCVYSFACEDSVISLVYVRNKVVVCTVVEAGEVYVSAGDRIRCGVGVVVGRGRCCDDEGDHFCVFVRTCGSLEAGIERTDI